MPGLKSVLLTVCASALGLLPAVPCVSSAGSVYQKMADDFVRYSTDKKVKNVAVIGFARKARTSREESEYFSEKLLASLSESGKVRLLERSQLNKVLEERRLSAAGVTEEPPEGSPERINTSDAIIVGTIFGTKDKLKIIAKMIDPLTGTVLHTVQAQTERQWEIVPEWSEFEFEVPDLRVIAEMFGEAGMNSQSVDFRDAPVNFNADTCNTRRARLSVKQDGALEAKAKYWALRMREPDFNSDGLKRNPGGEISDPAARKKFYDVLDRFYRASSAPVLSAAELDSVVSLMDEEKRVSDACGPR